MKRIAVAFAFLLFAVAQAWADGETAPARDPKQPVDAAYTEKIHKYTTQPYFTSPLVDYLPASKTVPARPESFRTRKMCTNTCACSKRPRRA